MKSSPLLLKWITYPAASYEAMDDYRGGMDAVAPVTLETVQISFFEDGEHMALLKLSSDHSSRPLPYKFAITAVASFSIDGEVAKKEYKTPFPDRLPSITAVNVARVLYSGAREYIAMVTSRATFGATMLESRLLEPSDVAISSDCSPEDIMKKVFLLTDEELRAAEERLPKKAASEQKPVKTVGAKKEAAKRSSDNGR